MVRMQWLASKFLGMGFKPSDVRPHGAGVIAAAVERYGILQSNPGSCNVPGTFLDVPAGTTMRALTHPSLMNRFLQCALPVLSSLSRSGTQKTVLSVRHCCIYSGAWRAPLPHCCNLLVVYFFGHLGTATMECYNDEWSYGM